MAELVDAVDSKSTGLWPCEFESRSGYHFFPFSLRTCRESVPLQVLIDAAFASKVLKVFFRPRAECRRLGLWSPLLSWELTVPVARRVCHDRCNSGSALIVCSLDRVEDRLNGRVVAALRNAASSMWGRPVLAEQLVIGRRTGLAAAIHVADTALERRRRLDRRGEGVKDDRVFASMRDADRGGPAAARRLTHPRTLLPVWARPGGTPGDPPFAAMSPPSRSTTITVRSRLSSDQREPGFVTPRGTTNAPPRFNAASRTSRSKVACRSGLTGSKGVLGVPEAPFSGSRRMAAHGEGPGQSYLG